MNYSDFVNEAVDKGFERPSLLFVAAHYFDVDMDTFLSECSEEESIWPGIYEFRHNGRMAFVLTEEDASRIVSNYQETLKSTFEKQTADKPCTVSCAEMAEAYYHNIYDVFDTVTEMELDTDGILFPKYYIAEC